MRLQHIPTEVQPPINISEFPQIIQGGMGIAVSGYRLANAVGKHGQMGVVSGTVIDVVHSRELQNGDPTGNLRRAYAHFPVPEMAQRVLDTYFIEGGKPSGQPFKNVPAWSVNPSRPLVELCIVANFAEVFLAKEGHTSPIGINYLEKIQLPVVCSVIGAMLAGVDAILMGAGIPKQMPQLIDQLAHGLPGRYKITVEDSLSTDEYFIQQDPRELLGDEITLHKPSFIAIISSHTLGTFLAKDENVRPDGFVVELPTAGGHNSPPRGQLQLDESGQPIYGERDKPDFGKIAQLELPFWIAGSWGKPDMLKKAIEMGARGIQVGTAFAYTEESGFTRDIKDAVYKESQNQGVKVITDPIASPSGFPFKVVQLPGTSSEQQVYEDRVRICDLSYLRSCYKKEDGSVGYRCPAEPIKNYVRKGGTEQDAQGRKCLCNALMSNIGLGQIRKGETEPTLVTSGDELDTVMKTLGKNNGHYSVSDVINYLLSDQ